MGMLCLRDQALPGADARLHKKVGDVSEEKSKSEGPVVIKKYANRRLYNTQDLFLCDPSTIWPRW